LHDVRDYLQTKGKLIVPIGTTEQHSTHLPFTTDTDIAVEVSVRAARKIGALVAPPIHYGLSQDHAGFPGSAWLRPETLGRVIEDVSISYAMSGFKRIIWINGHYGNQAAIQAFLMDMTGTSKIPEDTKVYGFSYWLTLPEITAKSFLSSEAGWHANLGETSLMLAINPTAVKMENAPLEWPALVGKPDLVMDCVATGTGTWRYVCPKTGSWGDSKAATSEKGERLLDEIVTSVCKTIDQIESALQEMQKVRDRPSA